jgi:hypothetical protein
MRVVPATELVVQNIGHEITTAPNPCRSGFARLEPVS